MILPLQAFGQDVSISGTISADSILIDLKAHAGDYFSGTLTGQDLHLYQNEPEQPRMRLLAQGSGGAERVHFIAQTEESRLELVGPDGAAFDLRLMRRPLSADQSAPTSAPESPALRAASTQLAAGKSEDDIWSQLAATGTPLVEGEGDKAILTFLYRGAQHNVRLLGGPSSDHDWLSRLGTSDIWFKSYHVPWDTRLSYRLAPDVPQFDANWRQKRIAILATAAADPANRSPWPPAAPDRWHQWSTVSLRDAPDQPGFPVGRGVVSNLRTEDFTSDILGNRRAVSLYRSPGYDPADEDAILLFMFDGPRAISELQIPGMLDTLTVSGKLPSVAAVFIDPIDGTHRGAELPGNPKFSAFLADELLPYVLGKLGAAHQRERTVLAGASYGGIGSTNAALDRPESFGAVISLSGSYWWSPEGQEVADNGLSYVANRLISRGNATETAVENTAGQTPGQMAEQTVGQAAGLRSFIAAGHFETSPDGQYEIRETSRQVHGILRALGEESHWREYSAGHDGFVWRGAYADGLLALFGQSTKSRATD
ncbi:alpha/beta hydrolase-fold protein [Phaeobacter sp. B1627]|uniref:alpha/beta hydrolase-fold protein n=1 Tax=Phaeobacter sp. B1627 TaxID=2583809 RepID=UPI00159EE8DD|nr:alpha/beta hydrolase-fold protein [Phaeobacter sp. B1627]